jgi:hypothetical protein
MQGFRKSLVVVCLSAAIALSTAANSTPTAHHGGSLDESIITQILDFFGIELQNRLSIPPG